MTARRSLAAATVAATVLALAACGGHTGTTGAAPPSPSTPLATTTTLAATTPDAAPTWSTPTATASPSHAPRRPTATPSADNCTAAARQPGHIVVHARSATGTGLTATATRLQCGADVMNDIEYDPVGPARDWAFAPGGVTAELMNDQPAAFQVDLATLVRTVNACATIPHQKPPFECFGGNDYDIALDAQGRVRTILQLFHP
ncbi:hypothetical protein [Streptacidiphilus sp. EB129]|uniref:hypothetical protein n=1 Tax=Streptacidiphilus sp. EB129 TaxID=3156262 RepID=UPI00351682C8